VFGFSDNYDEQEVSMAALGGWPVEWKIKTTCNGRNGKHILSEGVYMDKFVWMDL
jgi:hypothetical protein